MIQHFKYAVSELCTIRHDYIDQIAIVISADYLDQHHSDYNTYTLYLQQSGIITEVCEFAMDSIKENV